MGRYFAKVAAGLYRTTDTATRVLGRAPRTYTDWLEKTLPVGR